MELRTIDFETVTLLSGAHKANDDGKWCALELIAYMANEPWSDHPECVCPVLASFVRAWNDGLPDDERNAILKPFLPRLIGTRGNEALAEKRSMMAADWLVRTHTPAWLRLAGLTSQADALSELPEITSMTQVPSIEGPIEAARNGAAAARAAAGTAAWAAARAAARAAAGDAAWAAARDAAWDAARAAAATAYVVRDAVGDAAWDAAATRAWLAARDAARAAAWLAARAGTAARAAAGDAARAAARDAAWDAAATTAWLAARAAAAAGAGDAAWDAARDAAWDAAGAAARDALSDTRMELQRSTGGLLDRMIAA